MRKLFCLLAYMVFFTITAFSQQKTIRGQVTDDKGNPIPFASVSIKSTKQGTAADQLGNFSIKAKDGDVLVISSQGFSNKEITVGSQTTINASLSVNTINNLTEVVVSTGYNVKKTQRSTTSNAQVVTSQQLNVIPQVNLTNALAGKVAGIQVRSQSIGKLGPDNNASIRLRGDGNLGGQSILYIVDGTPVNSYDINPENVEDLTVLNGPTGAAIYGPQAADGAIVINTKRAKKGQKGIGVEVSSGIQFDKAYILPNYQNSYAGGGVSDLIKFTWVTGMPDEWKPLDGKFYHDYTDDASWGPAMNGQEYIPWYAWYPGTQYTGKTASLVPRPDNAKDFFNTGKTITNNVSFSKAGENFGARVAYSNMDITGIMPTSWLKRNTIGANFNFDVSPMFKLSTNLNYVTENLRSEVANDAYGNQSTGSFNQWFHRDIDMNIMKEFSNYRTPLNQVGGGLISSWNHSNPDSYNPANPDLFYRGNYWYNHNNYLDEIKDLTRRDRLFGDMALNFKPIEDLKFNLAYRKNYLTTFATNQASYLLERSGGQTGIRATYGTGQTFFNDDRIELTGMYSKKIQDFTADLFAGGEIVKITNRSITATTRNGLYIPDYYALSNSIDPIGYANNRILEKRRAIFSRATVGYKNYLFAEATLRNDWYSTLPANDNNIFVKSFGASFVFSDLLKTSAPWLSYGKLRASWGEVPQAVGPYSLESAYGVGADQWNGSFIMATPNGIISPTIKGAIQSTKEIGLDLRFLKNRVGISATYYNSKTTNSPVNIQINGASGFNQYLVNAGRIDRSGIELQLTTKPVVAKDFAWTLNASFAQIINNEVVALAPGVDRINVSNGANFTGITTPAVVHQVGETWGMVTGGGKTYIDGKVVLDANGGYVKSENVKFGSVLPDFTGGVQNSFTYKGLVLNINIDYQKGGKFFSLSDMFGSFSGLTARTAVLNDKGNPIRDAVANGGGVHVVGVDAGKNPVDMYVEAQDYFHGMVGNNVFDEYIYDLTFVKMREVSLGYRLPVEKWSGINKYVQNVTFSLVARNPWLIHATTKDFDPAEISNVYGENGQLPGTRSLGFNLKVGF